MLPPFFALAELELIRFVCPKSGPMRQEQTTGLQLTGALSRWQLSMRDSSWLIIWAATAGCPLQNHWETICPTCPESKHSF